MSNIFISYSHQDSDFARRLHADLIVLGHKPWLDKFELDTGDNTLTRIQEGLQDSRYCIVILSEAALQSKWVDTEWKEKLWSSIITREIKLLPVLKDRCEIPVLLRTLQYADFTQSYAVGFSQVAMRLAPPRATRRFSSDLIPMNFLNAIEWDARTHHVDHIRMACAHTVWSFASERALPLLQDALRDLREEVRSHARALLNDSY